MGRETVMLVGGSPSRSLSRNRDWILTLLCVPPAAVLWALGVVRGNLP